MRIFYPKFNREEIVRKVSENVGKLGRELPLLSVVLFGSYARGNYTVASDVDLLVVYGGDRNEEAYAIVKRTLDIPNLEPHVYTQTEFEGMRDVMEKMTKEGIVIFKSP